MIKDTLVVIPAIKKNAAIPDQLIKKLNGITLIQRAIDTAKEIASQCNDILVVTDSEEISLICSRNNIRFYYNSKIKLNPENIVLDLKPILIKYSDIYKYILLYRANAPLIKKDEIIYAYNIFLKDTDKTFISVKKDNRIIFKRNKEKLELIEKETREFYEEIRAFKIISYKSLLNEVFDKVPYILSSEDSIEIETYQDWWVCEKLLQQKRIVFNVVGSIEKGMGHIYRALSLAHEITNHEIIFVCEEKYQIAVDKIASTDYKVISSANVLKTIIDLKPSLLINDILDTKEDYIKELKNYDIKIVNFEDIGSGANVADLVINEIYDTPQLDGDNFRWGHKYYFLRDEFLDAKPHIFEDKVDSVLITFGGTDQNNLTLVTLKSIIHLAQKNDIKIYIVCGAGYLYKEQLESYINEFSYKNIELTYAVGVISKIMEKTPIAFSSNGRTVYELSDMNIPSVIISHHEREATHGFSTLEKGFINLGIYNEHTTSKLITQSFEKLVFDSDYRKLLFLNIKKYGFRKNKQKVLGEILKLIDS